MYICLSIAYDRPTYNNKYVHVYMRVFCMQEYERERAHMRENVHTYTDICMIVCVESVCISVKLYIRTRVDTHIYINIDIYIYIWS